MKTTRNFVFLTFIFASFIVIQFPQRDLAQNIKGEIAQLEASASASDAIFAQPITEENASATTLPDKNNKENLKTDIILASKSAAAIASSAAAVPYNATAYCLNGRTATGSGVRRGIIAADPRVLPLGTRVLISAGAWSGTYTVADTGGRIKGRKIDVWVPNSSEARRFGRRTVHIKVLGK